MVDDEEAIREQIGGFIKKRNPDFHISGFATGEGLLAAGKDFDIIFFDIQMEGMGGIEAVRALRQSGVDAVVIFITGIKEYVFEVFDVLAFHYLLKPIEEQKFNPNGSYKFMGLPGKDYPVLKRVAQEGAKTFKTSGSSLLRGLEYTSFAAGTDMLRPQMTGVYWDIKPDRLIFVATDTHKLVKFEDNSIASGIEGSFILPNKSTNVFRSVFSKDEEVTVTLDPERGVTFETDTFTFDSRLIKGRFPDYTRVIPENNPYTLTINRHQFTTAVRRVSLFVDEGHGLIKFRVTPDKLTIKASDNEYNTSGYETLASDFTGNEMIIGFSSSYLTELASVLWTDDIIFRLADPSRPAVIVPTEDKADTKLTMLLMPMNVQEF